MSPWITLSLVVGAYLSFLYWSYKWMDKNIDQADHWWDKQPMWLGWTFFTLWFPIIAIIVCFARTFALSRWLFAGKEYDRDFWGDVPDFD